MHTAAAIADWRVLEPDSDEESDAHLVYLTAQLGKMRIIDRNMRMGGLMDADFANPDYRPQLISSMVRDLQGMDPRPRGQRRPMVGALSDSIELVYGAVQALADECERLAAQNRYLQIECDKLRHAAEALKLDTLSEHGPDPETVRHEVSAIHRTVRRVERAIIVAGALGGFVSGFGPMVGITHGDKPPAVVTNAINACDNVNTIINIIQTGDGSEPPDLDHEGRR
jgi:hypothetical protein